MLYLGYDCFFIDVKNILRDMVGINFKHISYTRYRIPI